MNPNSSQLFCFIHPLPKGTNLKSNKGQMLELLADDK